MKLLLSIVILVIFIFTKISAYNKNRMQKSIRFISKPSSRTLIRSNSVSNGLSTANDGWKPKSLAGKVCLVTGSTSGGDCHHHDHDNDYH